MIASLIGEGSSDHALLPILRWALRHLDVGPLRLEWIDTRSIPLARRTLRDRVQAAQLVRPSDLLFVHRDADSEDPEPRYREILEAVGATRHVAVVPVRETEAWLLIDSGAIAAAAGRPAGAASLSLPPLRRLEELADPKRALHHALVAAHGTRGRRAERFDPEAAVHRVADLVEDWSPLLELAAFRRLLEDTRAAIESVRR